jgi:5-deoxy-glucuronate isomerase
MSEARSYTAEDLLVSPDETPREGLVTRVTPDRAGWELIEFEVRELETGEEWAGRTDGSEWAFVPLSGSMAVESSRGSWSGVGGRESVFDDLPHALYLPRETGFEITAETPLKVAAAHVPTDEDHPPRHVRPEHVNVEIRGGDNVTRQINDIIPPGFDCDRLVLVEVYTPSGGWSSYPPHKHDVHKEDEEGHVLEADLEEIYYYLIDKPDGFAYQRIYTDPESPLHAEGHPIDELLLARSDDVVLVPEGYQPVVSGHGYTTYYLNVLAGSAQSLANTDDPAHSWVKETYSSQNPALPVYGIDR